MRKRPENENAPRAHPPVDDNTRKKGVKTVYGRPKHAHSARYPLGLAGRICRPALCPARLQDDVLALDVAQVAQPLAEGTQASVRGTQYEHAEAPDLPHRRRSGGERRHEDGESKGDEEAAGPARHGSLRRVSRRAPSNGSMGASVERGRGGVNAADALYVQDASVPALVQAQALAASDAATVAVGINSGAGS
jgi:hypothetical protein